MTKRKNPADCEKSGRKSIFTPELSAAICKAIATTTDGLRKMVLNNPGFPSAQTICEWRFDHPLFAEQYAQAKRIQADLLAEEILEISDDSSNDFIEDKEGNEKLNSEHVQRSRLRVDSRKWIACKLLPKVYGDKVQNEVVAVVRHEDALRELE